MMNENKTELDGVVSPCIGVCVLNMEDVCEGCFRTVEEIGQWGELSQVEQRDVVRLSWVRAKESGRLL